MSSLRFFLGCSLAMVLTACLDSTPVCGGNGDRGLCEDRDPVVRNDASVEPLACESVEERAQERLESYQECQTDEDCVAATVEAGCLSPFLCTVSVARSANLDALQREALALRSERETCFAMGRGRSCAVARCAAPYSLRLSCDRSSKRCTAKYDPTLKPPHSPMDQPAVDAGGALQGDAGAGAQQSDSGTGDAMLPAVHAHDAAAEDGGSTGDASTASPGDPRFSCTTASDCAVKNVGNCCGYYPRCANVNAVFTPPDCSGGQAGVCGWPEITSCDCRANTCVSLQNGQQI